MSFRYDYKNIVGHALGLEPFNPNPAQEAQTTSEPTQGTTLEHELLERWIKRFTATATLLDKSEIVIQHLHRLMVDRPNLDPYEKVIFNEATALLKELATRRDLLMERE